MICTGHGGYIVQYLLRHCWHAGGVSQEMQAPWYADRMAYADIYLATCTYPCTRSGYTMNSAEERNATLAMLEPRAKKEYDLEELLMQVGCAA
jgi:hypothetical protein